MQKYTKLYFDFFGYDGSFVPCEICEGRATEIHHIHRRGKNNEWDADIIENIQAICRTHHIDYGDKKQFKSMLYRIHLKRLEASGKDFDREWILLQIEKYKPFEEEIMDC